MAIRQKIIFGIIFGIMVTSIIGGVVYKVITSRTEARTETRLEVLEAGFKNIDEFKRTYERAKRICEASDEELRKEVFEREKWGDPCKTEDGYNIVVFTQPEEFRKKYPHKVRGKLLKPDGAHYYKPDEFYYCAECAECLPTTDRCILEKSYNHTVFFLPEEWRQKYSEKIGNYYCNPQELTELVNQYRKDEFGNDGGCKRFEKYKELYQKVIRLRL